MKLESIVAEGITSPIKIRRTDLARGEGDDFPAVMPKSGRDCSATQPCLSFQAKPSAVKTAVTKWPFLNFNRTVIVCDIQKKKLTKEKNWPGLPSPEPRYAKVYLFVFFKIIKKSIEVHFSFWYKLFL